MDNKTKVWSTPEEYARLLLSDTNNSSKTKEELLNEILGHSISELTFLKRMIKYNFKRESSEDSLMELLKEYLDDLIKEKRCVQDLLRKEYINKSIHKNKIN